LGIGDWGLGIGDWAQSPIPNPQYTNDKRKNKNNYIYIIINFNNYLNNKN